MISLVNLYNCKEEIDANTNSIASGTNLLYIHWRKDASSFLIMIVS